MTPLFPRVQEVENIFHKILASKEACARLRETFNSSLEDFQGSEELNNETFSKVVLDSYSNQDIVHYYSLYVVNLCLIYYVMHI